MEWWNTIGVTAIFWIAISLIAVAASFFSYMARAARYRMLESLVEKGQQLPPELLNSLANAQAGPRGTLRGGIILVCMGSALTFFLWAMTSPMFDGPIRDVGWLPAVGAFPIMIGVGLLIIATFDRSSPRPKS
jgi:hypothetical protein